MAQATRKEEVKRSSLIPPTPFKSVSTINQAKCHPSKNEKKKREKEKENCVCDENFFNCCVLFEGRKKSKK